MLYETVQGTQIPALGFGTFRITGPACREAVRDALEIGYRHLDTAQVYRNEGEVGGGWRDAGIAREDFFLTTKVWIDKLDPPHVISSTHESLRKLQTEYVDLLLIHWPSQEVPVEKTLDAMMRLCEEGKTRHVGVSNFPAGLARRAAAHAPIFCNQVEYHPYLDQSKLTSLATEHGFLLTAYSPIAKGSVADDPVLQEIGEAHGKSPVQVTLRWLIQQERVAAIPKASSPENRRANFEIFDFELSEEEMSRIHGLARPDGRIVNPDFAMDWDS